MMLPTKAYGTKEGLEYIKLSRWNASPDYENSHSDNGDQYYNITVHIAYFAGREARRDMRIIVNDVSE